MAIPVLTPEGKHVAGYVRDERELQEFLEGLKSRHLSFAVLFAGAASQLADGSPSVDILVADDSVKPASGLLKRRREGIAVCLFTETGLPRSNYRSMALFPPRRARQLLEHAVPDAGFAAVPSPADRFFATAYCTLYFSGALPSGEPTAEFSALARANLAQAAAGAGITLEPGLTAGALDKLLVANGWAMPGETQERIANWSPYAASQASLHEDASAAAEPPGFTLFFIRQAAVDMNMRPLIMQAIEAKGFEILETLHLEGEMREKVTDLVRGGNWGRGPFPVSGGDPATILFCYDLIPHTVSAAQREEFPLLDDGRIALVKTVVRRLIESAVPAGQRFNPLHSTDNSGQAWRVACWLLPTREAWLRDEMKKRYEEFVTPGEVIRDLTSFGNRAKVELIDFHGTPAVRKTFRRTGMNGFANELSFAAHFADCPEVPELLDHGANYLVMPYYEQAPKPGRILGLRLPRPMKLQHVRQLAAFASRVIAEGFDPIDLIPRNNVLITADGTLKVIDFEFVYRHRGTPPRPERAWCFAGVPLDFPGDLPVAIDYLADPYAREWYPHTFLPLESFLYDPPWVQMLKRAVNYPAYLVWLVADRAMHSPRFGARRVAGALRRRLARFMG